MIIPEEQNAHPMVWNSCCMRLDIAAVIYFSQLGVSIGILSFCCYQLVRSGYSCDKGGPYWAAISMIIGIVLGRTSANK